MPKDFVSPLVELMVKQGLTQKEIAQALGVTAHTVTNWVTGKTEPRLTLEQWHQLAGLLGTTIDQLPRSFAPQPIHKTGDRSKS